MSVDWAGIADEVHDALSGVGFTATLTRQGEESDTDDDAGTPWGDAATGTDPDPVPYTVTVLDDGTKTRYGRDAAGALIPRTVRVLTISATGEAPQMGDTITLTDGTFTLAKVEPFAPGGENLLFDVEITL